MSSTGAPLSDQNPVGESDSPSAQAVVHSGGLRTASAEATLQKALPLACRLGVTRVAEITHLDRIGIPVFVAIRPNALSGSLSVNTGKGMSSDEARVGAIMEAIEYSCAEPGTLLTSPSIVRATARDLLDVSTRPAAIGELCPRLGAEPGLDDPLDGVEAIDWLSGRSYLVPAARVFVPYPPPSTLPGDNANFAYSTAGLASGNTLEEAITYGLAELIEHDILSFQTVRNTALRVDVRSLPSVAVRLVEKFHEANLNLWIHTVVDHPCGIPYFVVRIADPLSPFAAFRHAGRGCHPNRTVALVRALCEAAQSRLTALHGGRDDLVAAIRETTLRVEANPAAVAARLDAAEEIAFEEVPDHSEKSADLRGCLGVLIRAVGKVGVRRLCVVPLTPADFPLHVARVIAPGLERFDSTSWCIGPRLQEYVNAIR